MEFAAVPADTWAKEQNLASFLAAAFRPEAVRFSVPENLPAAC